MQEWKLPSQLVTTDREKGQETMDFFYTHESKRRIIAENDLIKALDFIDDMPKTKEIETFLAKFLDKTINN